LGSGLWCWLLFLCAPAVQAICPADLPWELDRRLDQPELRRTRWGLLVQQRDTDLTLYARSAEQYFIPASNAKLFTTAAALTALGADHRLRTSVYAWTTAENGTVQHQVALVGGGDPGLDDADLVALVEQMSDRPLSVIDRLLVDDSFFRQDAVNPNWEWEDVQAGYGAPVHSLNLNGNERMLHLYPQAEGEPLWVVWADPEQGQSWQVQNFSRTVAVDEPEYVRVGRDLSRPLLTIWGQLRVGSAPEDAAIAIPHPPDYALRQFQALLQDAGITVRVAQVVQQSPPAEAEEIAVVQSPPLSELLIAANQDSDNLYAEALLRLLGETRRSEDTPDSSLAAGLAAVETTLATLGVDPDGYALVDGSGIARQNLASPSSLVQVLEGMARSPQFGVFLDSLAVAGENGTLRDRFEDSPVAGNFRGKTGALSGVAALSGYLDPPNYPPLVVSILVNHFDQPVRTIRPVIDELVMLLAQLETC
jgi:D-alanyl-D-alanine carboxypeptidase/D-alanyl-D-alanine-endopeptidase (penicillin-binding protein 4)